MGQDKLMNVYRFHLKRKTGMNLHQIDRISDKQQEGRIGIVLEVLLRSSDSYV
jgi:hypothetical protein